MPTTALDPYLWQLLPDFTAKTVREELDFLTRYCAANPAPADVRRLETVREYMRRQGIAEKESAAEPVEQIDLSAERVEKAGENRQIKPDMRRCLGCRQWREVGVLCDCKGRKW